MFRLKRYFIDTAKKIRIKMEIEEWNRVFLMINILFYSFGEPDYSNKLTTKEKNVAKF